MVGRSLRQIVWARLRRDKVAIICLFILLLMYAIAFLGPVVAGFIGLSPYEFDKSAIGEMGGRPKGDMGGISPQHNQTVKGLRVKSTIRAGLELPGERQQHNQTVARRAR